MTPVITADRLTIRFGDFTAVNEVSFEIDKGELFGFLGPNGSGKTTIIKALCGLITPTQGTGTILGMDIHFYEKLPKLFPHADAKAWFQSLPENVLEYVALRNSSLQGAYFMLAARSLGLDCGPMSGFDNVAVDAAFFAGTTVKSNFLCNLGYGDASKLFPRSPRLTFEEACKVV